MTSEVGGGGGDQLHLGLATGRHSTDSASQKRATHKVYFLLSSLLSSFCCSRFFLSYLFHSLFRNAFGIFSNQKINTSVAKWGVFCILFLSGSVLKSYTVESTLPGYLGCNFQYTPALEKRKPMIGLRSDKKYRERR